MRDTDRQAHSWNRARIDALFEGFPPFSEEEAATNHFETNVNFLEAPSLAHKARSTWNNFFLKPSRYFSVTLDSGPIRKRGEWSQIITKEINKIMKDDRLYTESVRATGAQVILHGIGPKMWEKSKTWRPVEVGIEDLLVPSGTRVRLDNLNFFAVFRRYTPEELYRMTHGPQVDPGWNMPMVEKAMDRLMSEIQQRTGDYQTFMNPEKVVEYFKANSGYLDTDAVSTLNCWDFYFQEDDDLDNRWYRRIFTDNESYTGSEFLYAPERPFAGDLSQILHIQFGDGANVAPFLYHTVRSLGYLLYGVCQLQNRLRCSLMDAILRSGHEYFRIHGGDERARMQKADLVNLGIVPDGLEFVPRDQRWQPDEALFAAGLATNRQLMAENAASFVQDPDTGTAKELTATEVMARLNSANQLVSSLLAMSAEYAKFEYREDCRRFTQRDSGDPDIQRFRVRCQKQGVPPEYLNVERWDIAVERVMGGGNKTLELAEAKAMMEVRTAFDSEAQRDILRDYVLAVSDDPQKAEQRVPYEADKPITSTELSAQNDIGTLMNMAPVGMRQGIDHISYVETCLLSVRAIEQKVGMIGQPTPQQVMGLTDCIKLIGQHLSIIAQDPENAERVKIYNDALKQLSNPVSVWTKMLEQQMAAQQQTNGDQGKTAATLLTAQAKARIAEQSAVLKEKRKDFAFVKEETRKDAKTAQDLRRQSLETQAGIQATDMETAGRMRNERMTTAHDMALAAAEAESQTENPA